VPEGDVLFRTASTLDRWLAGRRVTASSAPALVGRRVEAVEARGKHLLVYFDSGHVLHTHLRMSGSWHVYPAGEPWRRPAREARLTLACGDRVAVCFNAPVVEVLAPGATRSHPALKRLGPDVLDEPLDAAEVVRRARSLPPDLALGELLLDQRVVAGVGNIWRCEALFVERHHPFTPQSALEDVALIALVATAGRLMRASLGPAARPPERYVYRRAGRPCRRCRTPIESRRQGEQARTAYWCPRCQALPAATRP
jgi:endonuclease-8